MNTSPLPICDFCSSPAVAWRYPCTDFTVYVQFTKTYGGEITVPWGSGGDWAACEICSALIEAGDWEGQAQRSFDTSPTLVMMQRNLVEGQVLAAITELHREFQRKRTGERVPQ